MTARILSPDEKLAWLRLARSENVGPVNFHHLLQRCGSAEAALDALPALAQRGGRGSALRIATRTQAERELEAHARLGAHLIASCEPAYPPRLAALEDAPPLITVIGDAAILATP